MIRIILLDYEWLEERQMVVVDELWYEHLSLININKRGGHFPAALLISLYIQSEHSTINISAQFLILLQLRLPNRRLIWIHDFDF